jgi:adenylylsulfate kinase
LAANKEFNYYIELAIFSLISGIMLAVIAFFLTGDFITAGLIGGADFLIFFVIYFIRINYKDDRGGLTREPFVLWFTGLSGSGKTTLAAALRDRLTTMGLQVELLDGDEVRSLFPNTGFSRDERNSHILRVGHIASLLEKNGVIVLTSLISPYRESRDAVRKMCRNFIEVHVATSLDECRKRDVKGLYEKAGRGEIKNFTGIDDPYEPPLNPEMTVATESRTIPESVDYIISEIRKIEGLKF